MIQNRTMVCGPINRLAMTNSDPLVGNTSAGSEPDLPAVGRANVRTPVRLDIRQESQLLLFSSSAAKTGTSAFSPSVANTETSAEPGAAWNSPSTVRGLDDEITPTRPDPRGMDRLGPGADREQTCIRCHQSRPIQEFVSENTSRPIKTCRRCLEPKPPTVRTNPEKRTVSMSKRKAEENTFQEKQRAIRRAKKARVVSAQAQEKQREDARAKLKKSYSGRAGKRA